MGALAEAQLKVVDDLGEEPDARFLESVPQLERTVLVVDDCQLILAGMRALLGREPWVTACLTASDPAMAMKIVATRRPHVVLTEMQLGDVSGFELTRRIHSVSPGTRVALMSSTGNVTQAQARANGGVYAFLPKSLPAASVVKAVNRICRGYQVFPTGGRPERGNTLLSNRERDVLCLLMEGLTNREIGSALHLSRHTVKQHTSSIYKKLEVRNRAEAVTRACELGIGA